jgi:hypothetical protein
MPGTMKRAVCPCSGHSFGALGVVLVLLAPGCGRLDFASLPDAQDGARDGDADGAQPDSAAQQSPNLMFITSTTHLGSSLVSLGAVDSICAARAAEAGLSGTYVAWFSHGGVDARDRLAGARGWVRLDGAIVADRVDDLVTIGPRVPPLIDEQGAPSGLSGNAATGTAADGTANATCDTGPQMTSGSTRRTLVHWTDIGLRDCTVAMRLACFGIDRQVAVTIPPPPAGSRRAFLSSPWMPASGLAAADARCAADASAAGLVGSFRALLPVDGQTAASRFDLTGPTWVRMDGMPIVLDAAGLAGGSLFTSLNTTAAGAHVRGSVATGGVRPGVAGTLADTCADWSDAGAAHSRGASNSGGPSAFNDTTSPASCATALPVYCLQE